MTSTPYGVDISLPNDPTEPEHATNKSWVEDQVQTRVNRSGDTMAGNLSMDGAWSITNAYRMIGAGSLELYDGTWASGIILDQNYVTIAGKKIDLLASPGPVSIISQSADLTLAGYPNVLLEGHPRSTYTPDAADSLTNKAYVDGEIENHTHPGTEAEVYLDTVDPGVLGYDLIWADPDQVLTEAEYLTQTDADLLYSPLGHSHGQVNMVGEIKMVGFTGPPAGWLMCNGQDVSRATYAALFAAVGTSFGAGNGSTTFGLPDLSDRVPMGGGILGATGGADSVTLAEAQLPGHTHTTPNHTHTVSGTAASSSVRPRLQMHSSDGSSNNSVRRGQADGWSGPYNTAVENSTHTHSVTGTAASGGGSNSGSTGSGQAVDITPSHQRIAFIIYAGV